MYAAGGALLLTGAVALAGCGTDNNNVGGRAGASGVPTAEHCASGTINVAGSSAQANAMAEWVKAYQASCDKATVNYQANGSGAGIQQFTQGKTAFAGSDSPLTADERAAARKRCEGNRAIHLPMVVGPIAVVYNLEGVDDLQLTPGTLARIYTGKIDHWDDPAIARDNPKADLPSALIRAFHRSDSSGTTDNFTAYLADAAPTGWSYGHDKTWKADGGQGAKGSDGVTTAVQQTTGTIGYVELSYAQSADLSMANIANASGNYVSLTGKSVGATISSAKVVGKDSDLELAIDYNTKAPKAYPIVLVTYEIACQQGLPNRQAKLVESFLSYAASQEAQDSLADLGYAPLPVEVASRVRGSVKSLA